MHALHLCVSLSIPPSCVPSLHLCVSLSIPPLSPIFPQMMSPSSPHETVSPPPVSPSQSPHEIEDVVSSESTPLTHASPSPLTHASPSPTQPADNQITAEMGWLAERRGSLMIVAMMAIVFSGEQLMHPVGGVWADSADGHKVGQPVLADTCGDAYFNFMLCNTVSIMSSFMIIMVIVSGFPFVRGRGILWLLTGLVWVSMGSMLLIFAIYMVALTDLLPPPISFFFLMGCLGFVVVMVVCQLCMLFVARVRRPINGH